MSDPVVPAEGAGGDAISSVDNNGTDDEGPKRKGKAAKKHTVGKVLLATVLTLAIVTGLGVVFFYRHLNGNLNVIETSELLGDDRPEKVKPEGPQEPLNILVMGSRVIGTELARELVRNFLGAVFTNEERHRRRLEKVKEIELRYGKLEKS